MLVELIVAMKGAFAMPERSNGFHSASLGLPELMESMDLLRLHSLAPAPEAHVPAGHRRSTHSTEHAPLTALVP
jgi:hypothetical protein